MISNRAVVALSLLYIFFVIEFLFITFLRNELGPFVSPVVFYAAGCGIFVAGIYYFLDAPAFQPATLQQVWTRKGQLKALMLAIITGGGTFFVFKRLKRIMHDVPIDPSVSDVIPALQVAVARFLNGEYVYVSATLENGLTYFPTYLPMQWLPFTIAGYFGFDFRILALCICLIGFVFYQVYLLRLNLSFVETLLKAALPFTMLLMLMKREENIFGHTVEAIVVGYYFILVAGVLSQSAVLRATGLVFCLLSRFSMLFWLPLYAVLVFLNEQKKNAFKIAAYVFIGICVLYVIPFMSKDWTIFAKGQANYTTAAMSEWVTPLGADKPYHLLRGLGFASFVYEYGPKELLDKIALIRKIHIAVSLLAVALTAVIYYFIRKRIDHRVYLLLALKFYLATFYAFIHVPYSYLTAVSIFLSAWVVLLVSVKPELLQRRVDVK